MIGVRMHGPLLAVSSKAGRAFCLLPGFSLNLPRRDVALPYLALLQERSETVPQIDKGSIALLYFVQLCKWKDTQMLCTLA